jgi:mannose-6-phosphate isomerase-like protein (cupin superfamily)
VEVNFPPGARVAYETGGRESTVHQQVWVMSGRIDIVAGSELHELHQGDCLAMRLNQPLIFSNPASSAARYIVALSNVPGM